VDESHFKALKELARDGHISQRDLAAKVGLSLGRVNYLIHSLIEKGYIKAQRFRNSNNKLAYMYILTPRGIRQKVEVTQQFITRKTREYERLLREVEELKEDVAAVAADAETGEPRDGVRGGEG
jgi:EPS-associated MarR family transcriptional regulator